MSDRTAVIERELARELPDAELEQLAIDAWNAKDSHFFDAETFPTLTFTSTRPRASMAPSRRVFSCDIAFARSGSAAAAGLATSSV